jgi:hypothetical protein
MIPALMAAKPLIKYGVMAGIVIASVGSIWTHGYFTGKKAVHEEWDAAIANASVQAAQESVKANAMESEVVKANDAAERVIEAKAEHTKKEVIRHARKDPKPLTAATIAIYDELIRLPNEAGVSVPFANPSAGTPEVSRGGVAAETLTAIQDENGNSITLTTEELAQAAVDFAEKYALMKNAYKGLSEWNDGRERLEVGRLIKEE